MYVFYASPRPSYSKILFLSFCGTILFIANNAHSLTCYVCGGEEKSKDCDNFNPSTRNLYTKECSTDSQACSIFYNKDDIITNMACEEKKFNVCRIANRIEYCYCTTNLCNGNKPITKSITDISKGEDDEDANEGSGSNRILPSVGLTISPIQTTLQPPNTGCSLHSTFVVIFTAVLLH